MENKVDYTVTRQEVETMVARQLTDREWEVMSSEIESFIDYAIWQQMWQIWDELPNTIAEDDKYNN